MAEPGFQTEVVVGLAPAGVGSAGVEIVERKGLGHPDSICDGVMESVSVAFCREYHARFGHVLHYNCDKSLLAAGRVEHQFGGGRVIEPMRLVIGDRATADFEGRQVDVSGIAIEAARTWFTDHVPRVDPLRHVIYQVELRPGSEELRALFAEDAGGVLGANDTSAAVGFAPLSPTEAMILEAERHLNSRSFKGAFPETGEDVKVMGVRRGTRVDVTVAMPFLDSHIEDETDYFRRKAEVQAALADHLEQRRGPLRRVDLVLNALDRPGLGVAGIYLSVLGTSAEHADSGQVGRGNAVNGLIALGRASSSEAAAGKNPMSHVGKIYTHLAFQLAESICAHVEGVCEVTTWLTSRIGDRVDRPRVVYAQLRTARGATLRDLRGPVRRVIDEELSRVPELCARLAGLPPRPERSDGLYGTGR